MTHALTTFLIVCSLLWTANAYALVDILTFSGNPATMTISTAVAGSNPTAVTDTSTTYSLTAVLSTKISAVSNLAMPTGVTLQITLAAPAGATSQGPKTISTTSTDLVTSIAALTIAGPLAVTYTLSATVAAAIQSNTVRTITYTLQ